MTVIVADDHTVFREGLISLLSALPAVKNVLPAQNGMEVIELVKNMDVHIVLMDIEMPGMNGVEATRIIKNQTGGRTAVIALTMFNRRGDLLNLYDAGVDGYLLKDCSIREVASAMISVREGKEYYCMEVKEMLFKALHARKKHQVNSASVPLSEREKEVLSLICEQYSTEEIAGRLYLSPLTVNNHRRNILMKTGAKNLAGLVVYALQHGIYKLPDNNN